MAALAQRQAAEKAAAEAIARQQGWPIRTETEGGATELMAIRNGRVLVYGTENVNAAITTAADKVRDTAPYNLGGSGWTIGLWDAGSAISTHREFGGRITVKDNVSSHEHSSHVAGTLAAAGVDPKALGMAPRVRVDSYEWTMDITEMTARGMAAPGEADALQLSNHSYGNLTGWYYDSTVSRWRWYGAAGNREAEGFGLYDDGAAAWDALCWEAPYFLPFKSAGNDRYDTGPSSGQTFEYFNGLAWVTKTYAPATDPKPDNWDRGGFDTMPDISSAKNVLTIGAVDDAVASGQRALAGATMPLFSGWGPADDGRVKPDVVANGVSLYSCHNRGDATYLTLSGTSMSSPNAAGSAVLLTEYFGRLTEGRRLSAAALKGIIIHTADDLGTTGPDYKFGWGLVNVKAAADLIQTHATYLGGSGVHEATLSSNVTRYVVAGRWDGRSPLRATLCWTDPPGVAATGLDDATPKLVNDLDLRIIAPDGVTNFPYVLLPQTPDAAATNGDNRLDNVEQVLVVRTPSTNGFYQVVVQLDGALAQPEQPLALIVSGLAAPPRIVHTPLENQAASSSGYVVDARITATTALATNSLLLCWNTNGSTEAFTSNHLMLVSNSLYRATLPAQPVGTDVYYYLAAREAVGLAATHPADAPATLHRFRVAPAVQLSVFGSPENHGTVSPAYGSVSWPSGRVVRATAGAATPPVNGRRMRCAGWVGTASVPAIGTSNSVTFALESDSVLMWRWEEQFSLALTSSVPGIVNTTLWCNADSVCATVTAPAAATIGSTVYRFAEWRIDNQRWPAAGEIARNPAAGIVMDGAHGGAAIYLPETRDSDGDALADWWEIFYFGSLAASWDEDPDGDGYLNLEEYGDRSNPRDRAGLPGGPLIAHTPLANPQEQPAPWRVTATITDNDAVASATLRWRRNGLNWRQTPLLPTDTPGEYAANLPAPGVLRDTYEYRLEAADRAGYDAQSGPYTFGVVYPVIAITPTNRHMVLRAGDATNVTLTVANGGNTQLVWTTSVTGVGLRDDVEAGEADWTHGGKRDLWHIATLRAFSGTHAWYCGADNVRQYFNSMDASLISPLIQLAPGARLVYRQWLRTEVEDATHTWDGAVVELSTDGGLNYTQIAPVGGYPYLIVNNLASPFPFYTPCFGGTGGWQQVTFDLGAYAGMGVRLRFRLGSDEFVTDEGWYVDDLAIGPVVSDAPWLTLSVTNGVLAPGRQTNVAVQVDSATVPTGTDTTMLVALDSNDPVRPVVFANLTLSSRTPPLLAALGAAHTATNGSGWVTLSNRVADADGETCELELGFSADGGRTWSPPHLVAARASVGQPALTNAAARQVTGLLTRGASGLVTNLLTATWSTTNATPPLVLCTNTLVRARLWDGVFWSVSATSQPFLVDNEAPAAPGALADARHAPRTWSADRTLALSWMAADDGRGSGVSRYRVGVAAGAQPAWQGVTNGLAGAALVPGHGSNWWAAVQAEDARGNRGAPVFHGPLWVDTRAPSAELAAIAIRHSQFGPYVFGTAITSAWSRFSDEGSGLAGYYVALADGGGTTNGQWTVATNAVTGGARLNATNTVFVWARDRVGLIGPAAHAAVIVLTGDTDYDGDSLSNDDEEFAGTDAVNRESALVISRLQRGAAPQAVVVTWSSITGRVYALDFKSALGVTNTAWLPLPGALRLSGTGGTMTHTDTAPAAVQRYYRLRVSGP